MFTQDIVDFLNRGGTGRQSSWLESNPSIHSFVTCPRVIIRPTLFNEALRVSVTENQYGRFVTILYRSGERRYIFQIRNENVTVEAIEKLIHSIENKGGVCRIERLFLVIDLPLGYLLDISDENLSQIIIHQHKTDRMGIG
jgi:hypothetical protein